MTQIALIADIHGNIPALEAVERDIKMRKVDKIYCIGDMCGRGPNGSAVVDWCRKNCEIVIMGNWEDFFIRKPDIPKSLKYIKELGEKRFEYIKTLPLSHKMWISGKRLHLFHGRPLNKNIVFAESPINQQLKMFEVLKDEFTPDIVGFADIHRQFRTDFQRNPKILFNTGSVGNSYCTPTACYTIIKGKVDSREKSAFSLEFVSLPYDIDRAIKNAVEQSDWFDPEEYIKEITTGNWHDVQ